MFHHILSISLYPVSSIVYEPLWTLCILFPDSVFCCCIKYGGSSRSLSQRKGRGVVLCYPEVLVCGPGTSDPQPSLTAAQSQGGIYVHYWPYAYMCGGIHMNHMCVLNVKWMN